MRKIRVLLVDDHLIFCEALAAILQRFRDIEVVGVADDGVKAVQETLTVRPDVVVMDLKMPGLSGLKATQQLLAQQPVTRVLILTAYPDSELATQAMEAGAYGYLLKDVSSVELVNAIQAIYRGERVLAPTVATRLAFEYCRLAQATKRSPALTDRERQMLQLIAQGQTNRQIAQQMNLALQTVKNTLSGLYAKLESANRAEAVARAVREGWVTLPPHQDRSP